LYRSWCLVIALQERKRERYPSSDMASVDQLARLFKAIAAGDLGAAQEAAVGIADAEERIGHHTAAQMLRGSLRPNLTKPSNGTNGSHHNEAWNVVLAQALTPVASKVPLRDVHLRPVTRSAIADICLEWVNRVKLEHAGLPRRSRLLFYGPPGCGKSITASALAQELSLPIYVVRFDAVVGAYLGQTAAHLRELFRFAEATPCVLLIDEVDALGKHRGDPLDIGELHRIVITLMQELEHARPAGYTIATSNLPKQLDEALWRRFDLVLKFQRPSRRELERYASARGKALKLRPTEAVRKAISSSASYSDAEQFLLAQARQRLLNDLKRT